MSIIQRRRDNTKEKVEEILSNLLTGSYLESNINDMCLRVVKAGGKRIRPKLAILAYHALNKKEFYKRALNFAAATELLHTATLVHDDVIDKADCRRGKEHNYDIVEGPMADDQIWDYVEDYMSGSISKAAFWELVKFKYPTHQIVFCTEDAIKTLHFEGSTAL